MNLLQELEQRRLIHPPRWLADNTVYLVYTGSVAYGVSSAASDLDCYGISIPPKDMVFPHLRGEILGFGRQTERFEVWQQHHIQVPDWEKEYDFQVYAIVKFFQLAMDNNPNIVDALFVPHTCVLCATAIGQMIRERRRDFLHKGAWHRFKGYAYSQLHKMKAQTRENPKRQASIDAFGYDVKFAYHVVRLLLEVEQILQEGDIDLQRHNKQLQAIRRGEWTEEYLREWVAGKELELEKTYNNSDAVPLKPNEPALKQLLLDCLEHHYGSLSDAYVEPDRLAEALRQVRDIAERALRRTE